MLGLPDVFCFDSKKGGGGVIQSTASESTLISMLGARSKVLSQRGYDNRTDNSDDLMNAKYDLMSQLVAYTSTQSHSSVEKAALLSFTRIRLLPTGPDNGIDVDVLKSTIHTDKQKGLIPFIVIATLGTTNTCAFDDLESIGKICMFTISYPKIP